MHYIGQYWDAPVFDIRQGHEIHRKIREWVTLDWILNYTFNFAAPAGQSEVPGYAKGGGKNAEGDRGQGQKRDAGIYRGIYVHAVGDRG